MGTEKTDGERRDDESARADAEDLPVTPDVAPPTPAEGNDCTDPGPGRDPRPDLRGA